MASGSHSSTGGVRPPRRHWRRPGTVLLRIALAAPLACQSPGKTADNKGNATPAATPSSQQHAKFTATAPSPRGAPAPLVPTATAPRSRQGPTPTATATALPDLTAGSGFTSDIRSLSVREQQAALLEALRVRAGASEETLAQTKAVFDASTWMSFGNPKVSHPSMTREECYRRRATAPTHPADPRCGSPNMVVIDAHEDGNSASSLVCIDQYEYPNLVCEYPLIWVRASEASALCEAQGKRLCDAHEWEGACAGKVLSVDEDYPWASMPRGIRSSPRRDQRLWLEYEHNRTREVVWAYGSQLDHSRCATGANKAALCDAVDWGTCGSNTYPAGAFPDCVSSMGVYDQHGNAAEHMNLALEPKELASTGGSGWTEMKGSWFVSGTQATHPDDCRWRAKSWHTTLVKSFNSHRNYHLGFRCCKSGKGQAVPETPR